MVKRACASLEGCSRKAMAPGTGERLEGAVSQSGSSLGAGMGGWETGGATTGNRRLKEKDGALRAMKH